MKHGEIHPKRTLFFRFCVGKITDLNKDTYEMSINVSDHSPIIESKKTGKWFTLSWKDIIDLAIDMGIDSVPSPK